MLRKTERNVFIDVFKAVAIIAIVIGHAPFTGLFKRFVFSFNLMAFFFISGYSFRESYLESKDTLRLYVGKRFLHAFKLFFIYTAFYCSMYNVFIYIGVINAMYFNVVGIISNTLSAVIFNLPVLYMGVFWIIPVLILTQILFSIILYYLHHIFRCETVETALTLVLVAVEMLLALFLYKYQLYYSYYLQVAFLALPVITIGFLCKRYYNTIKQYVTWYGGTVAAILIILILSISGKTIDLSKNQIISIFLFYPITFLGLYFGMALTDTLTNSFLAKVLALIGQNTYHIMALHLVCFKLADFSFAKITGFSENLAGFPSSEYFSAWIYLIIGITLPVVLMCFLRFIFKNVQQFTSCILSKHF